MAWEVYGDWKVEVMEERWEYIKKRIQNNEISYVVEMCNKMDACEAKIVKERLIQELRDADTACYRNTIAIILGDLKCDEAIDILLELILAPQNKNCRGSLIYALQSLNCEHRLSQLMCILIDGNYEVKWNMHTLLSEKKNLMNRTDKQNCIKILKEEKDKLEETIEYLEDIIYNILEDKEIEG